MKGITRLEIATESSKEIRQILNSKKSLKEFREIMHILYSQIYLQLLFIKLENYFLLFNVKLVNYFRKKLHASTALKMKVIIKNLFSKCCKCDQSAGSCGLDRVY